MSLVCWDLGVFPPQVFLWPEDSEGPPDLLNKSCDPESFLGCENWQDALWGSNSVLSPGTGAAEGWCGKQGPSVQVNA